MDIRKTQALRDILKDKSLLRPRTGTLGLRVGGASPACVVQFRELMLRRE